ncbi:MAG: hypothetical protein IPJ30_15255 [Acidobacteria bacterium]|nr:hypothetical protein [Acidobacteriota bacterium]
MNSQHNQLPEFEILEVFRECGEQPPYLERKLREAIRLSKADPRLSDREFLKTNLESMQRERLIGEIEAHSDSLRGYYLTSVGFERYCARKATRVEGGDSVAHLIMFNELVWAATDSCASIPANLTE